MIRFFIGALLAELVTAGALGLGILGGTWLDGAFWWREAQANGAALKNCQTKHDQLLRNIQKEGLWKRLGMPQQPWLR